MIAVAYGAELERSRWADLAVVFGVSPSFGKDTRHAKVHCSADTEGVWKFGLAKFTGFCAIQTDFPRLRE